jgi:TonB family protein
MPLATVLRLRGQLHRVALAAAIAGSVLAPAVARSATTRVMRQTGTIRGIVRDGQGSPVASAEVQWLPSGAVVRSKEDGSYTLIGVPVGPALVRVRRIGYLATQREITVSSQGTATADWKLARAPQEMAVLTVNARKEPSDGRLAGYRARLEAKRGGHFITRERIEQSGNRSMLDAFRGIPGVRIGTPPRGVNAGRLVRFRSSTCQPLVFIDGFAASAADFDFESIDLNMVEGIELYLSSNSVPPELMGPRGLEQCGVVAVWSRPAQARMPRAKGTDERRAELLKELAAGKVLTAEQVDTAATLTNGDLEVDYPEVLWRTGVNGQATVEFVIDRTGRIDWGTLAVISATHVPFGTAVMQALVPTKWDAAIKGQSPVAQLVVLTIEFTHPPLPPGAAFNR